MSTCSFTCSILMEELIFPSPPPPPRVVKLMGVSLKPLCLVMDLAPQGSLASHLDLCPLGLSYTMAHQALYQVRFRILCTMYGLQRHVCLYLSPFSPSLCCHVHASLLYSTATPLSSPSSLSLPPSLPHLFPSLPHLPPSLLHSLPPSSSPLSFRLQMVYVTFTPSTSSTETSSQAIS